MEDTDMNKKFFALLIAALVLLCTVSCTDKNSGNADTLAPFESDDTAETVTDAQGNVVTETEAYVPDEVNPTFSDVSMKIVIVSPTATIRTAPDKNDASNAVAWPSERTELTVTGESEQWYRLSYGGEVRYIRKSVVAPASILEGFTDINDVVVVNTNANIRSVPLKVEDKTIEEYIIRFSIEQGTELERVAVGAEWSLVKVTVTVEGESGEETQVEKQYYINNSCITAKTPAATESETA